MAQERDNSQWIEALQAEGALRDAALSDLRGLLLIGLKTALKSRSDFVESLLDDFVQDALVRVLRALDQFQSRSRFVTWSTAIAIRVALTELRKRRWRDVSLEKLVADTGFEPRAAAASTSSEPQPIVEAMYRIIASDLTDKQRTVLLAEIKGMAQEEIARQMGSNRNALYKLSHDARQRLKQGLEKAGFTAQDYALFRVEQEVSAMSLSRPELQKILEVVRATQHVEIDCDGCLLQVGEFAELHLVGRPIPDGLKAVEQHLSICDECREEYELLCLALRK